VARPAAPQGASFLPTHSNSLAILVRCDTQYRVDPKKIVLEQSVPNIWLDILG
jgi:hypothetical protein